MAEYVLSIVKPILEGPEPSEGEGMHFFGGRHATACCMDVFFDRGNRRMQKRKGKAEALTARIDGR